jgi:hypothetical protein
MRVYTPRGPVNNATATKPASSMARMPNVMELPFVSANTSAARADRGLAHRLGGSSGRHSPTPPDTRGARRR